MILRKVLFNCLLDFVHNDSLTISSSIAYNGLLAFFPFLLLLLGLSGAYIQHYELGGGLTVLLNRFLPMKPNFIMENLVGISKAYGRVGLASFLLLLWSSSGVFMPIETALNGAWHVRRERPWWRSRLLALEMSALLGIFFLLFIALAAINVFINHWAADNILARGLPWFQFAYSGLVILATFGMTLAMFIGLYMNLPNRPLRVQEILPGALVTAILWELARAVFILLLRRFNYRHVYGSIGAVVALMTWAYVSAAVMLFGAGISYRLYCALYPDRIGDEDATPAQLSR